MHKEMESEIVKKSNEAEKCNKVYNDSIKLEERYKK